jgi:hypothetical protein
LTDAILWEPLLHSLTIGLFVTVISVPLGALMAWLMVRTDIPGKKLLGMLIIIPYMIPSWCKALSWLAVFRNSTSGSLGLLTGLGVNIPDWLAYGPFAIICVMVMHYYAFSYIMVSGSLRSINSELEEMGEIQGANKIQILRDHAHARSPPFSRRHHDDFNRSAPTRCATRQPHQLLRAATRMKEFSQYTPRRWLRDEHSHDSAAAARYRQPENRRRSQVVCTIGAKVRAAT